MNKDLLYKIVISFMLIVIMLMSFNTCRVQREATSESNELKKSIISADRLIKEKDGQYSKLVDYYKSERDLIKDLKTSNSELYHTIKKNDEKLLNITNALISLDKKVVSGFAQTDPIDTNKLNLTLRYPTEKDPFIFWDGWVNKHSTEYQGTFSFGKLPIKVILSEEKRGLWKSRIVGPDWLKIDSMSISSLPPQEYPTIEPKNVQWLVGATYYRGMNSTLNGIGVNFGVNLFDRHSLIIGANTLQQVSLGYTFKIKTFKRNK